MHHMNILQKQTVCLKSNRNERERNELICLNDSINIHIQYEKEKKN